MSGRKTTRWPFLSGAVEIADGEEWSFGLYSDIEWRDETEESVELWWVPEGLSHRMLYLNKRTHYVEAGDLGPEKGGSIFSDGLRVYRVRPLSAKEAGPQAGDKPLSEMAHD